MPARLLTFGLRLPTQSAHSVGEPGAPLEEVGALLTQHLVLGLVVLISHVLVVVVIILYDALSIRSVPAALVSSCLPST